VEFKDIEINGYVPSSIFGLIVKLSSLNKSNRRFDDLANNSALSPFTEPALALGIVVECSI